MLQIIVLFLLLAIAGNAAPIVCANGFHTLVYQEFSHYKDDYTFEEETADFWTHHQRFGVIREKDRLILIARDEAMARQLLADMSATGAKKVQRKKIGGAAYDITDFADPLAKRLVGRWVFDGPNCWNLCLIHRELTGAIAATRDTEFRHWMASPLSQEVRNVADLQPGDIVAFRQGDEEVHGAVYLSPRILLTKNGTEEVRPYRLMDLNEVYNVYRPMSNDIKLFRVKALPAFLAENPALKTPALTDLMTKMSALDAKISFYAMQDEPTMMTDAYQVGANQFRRERRATAKELLAQAQADVANVSESRLKSIYEGLIIRLSAWAGGY